LVSKLEHLNGRLFRIANAAAIERRDVLTGLEKTAIDNVGWRSDAGRLLQTRGPSTAKDRSPNVNYYNKLSEK